MKNKLKIPIWALITLIYALFTFTHLGSIKGPQTTWEAQESGSSVTVDLGSVQKISALRFYLGICSPEAKFRIDTSLDGENFETYSTPSLEGEGIHFLKITDLYKYITYEFPCTTRFVRLTALQPTLRIVEVAIMRENNPSLSSLGNETGNLSRLPLTNVSGEGLKAFDEQDLIPRYPSFLDEFYFDEIYHARTALEYIEGIPVYEITHPPLGKLLIALGIKIFGMTGFGWRFMGALAGVLMLPLMYRLGLLLFKEERYANIAVFILALDFMHYSQTHIATIDSFTVLFIMAMYYFMYLFIQGNFLLVSGKAFRRNILYLFLSGLFMGLACATKWTGVYASMGLALVFFYGLISQVVALKNTASPSSSGMAFEMENNSPTSLPFPWKRILHVLGLCLLFFIVIPLTLYIASYIPSLLAGYYDLRSIWDNQLYMLTYHSQLTEPHSFASPWYSWPLMLKPCWYYVGSQNGNALSISSFGNPIIWWSGFLAIFVVLVNCFKKKVPTNALWITIGYWAQYIPWFFISRPAFIYHYFGSSIFMMLGIVWCIQFLEESTFYTKRVDYALKIYFVLMILAVFLFLPVVAGLPTSEFILDTLEILPDWIFFSS